MHQYIVIAIYTPLVVTPSSNFPVASFSLWCFLSWLVDYLRSLILFVCFVFHLFDIFSMFGWRGLERKGEEGKFCL
jgi:hypothetical protein